jgi:hypothetical protein
MTDARAHKVANLVGAIIFQIAWVFAFVVVNEDLRAAAQHSGVIVNSSFFAAGQIISASGPTVGYLCSLHRRAQKHSALMVLVFILCWACTLILGTAVQGIGRHLQR